MTDPDTQLAQALQAVKAAHFDADGAACDYATLVASRERGRLAACLGDLAAFDPKRVRIPAQTALWVNVFNAGVLRDIPELELAASLGEVQAFFERPRLRIGGQLYSLDDVQHGLLRGNLPKNGRLRPPMLRDDPRLAYMPIAYDERIHFAMHSACRSSPPLRVFDGGHLDVQFEDAATWYVRRSVRIEAAGADQLDCPGGDVVWQCLLLDDGELRRDEESPIEASDRRIKSQVIEQHSHAPRWPAAGNGEADAHLAQMLHGGLGASREHFLLVHERAVHIR